MERKPSRFGRIVVLCVIVAFLTPSCVSAAFDPWDTYWFDQWGPKQIETDWAWDMSYTEELTNPGTNNIVVAVIDSGISDDHDDIPYDQLWTNTNEHVGDWGTGGHADHYPGRMGFNDDGDQWTDFEDLEVKTRDWDGKNGHLCGDDDITEGYWNPDKGPDGAYDWRSPQGNHDDDLNDYYIACNDDDENGYDDDIHGWDFGMGDCVLDCEPTDHGHMVAGIIGASIDNGYGVAGMAQVDLMILKASTDITDVDANAAKEAIQYAIRMGAHIITTSWHLVGDDTFFEAEIASAKAGNIMWVASSGKDNGAVGYPAKKPDVIAVGASDLVDNDPDDEFRAYYSNKGANLDVIAPGGADDGDSHHDIVSTTSGSQYAYVFGTSFAVPHVVGTAALMMSCRPSLSVEQITMMIKSTTTDITDQPGPRKDKDAAFGKDSETGWGEISASRAVYTANSVRTKWSDGKQIQLNTVDAGEEYQPSFVCDEEGNYHVVWVDHENGGHEVFYASRDPSGGVWMPPTSLATPAMRPCDSQYVDIYYDSNQKLHVSWIEKHVEMGQTYYQIYYTKMKVDGTIISGPTIVLDSTNEKGYTNVFTDYSNKPRIVYAEKVNGDWDIWWVWHDGVGWSRTDIAAWPGIEENKPSVDILTFGDPPVNYHYIAYERLDPTRPKWEIWLGSNWGAETWPIAIDNFNNRNPHLVTDRAFRFVYVVWTKENAVGNADQIRFQSIWAWNKQSLTYGADPSSRLGSIKVGQDSIEQVPYDIKAHPKVAVNYIGDLRQPWGGGPIQVNVIWREWDGAGWSLFGSTLTNDGRSLTPNGQEILFPCLSNAIPQITGSLVQHWNEWEDWLDADGNSHILYFGEGGAIVHLFLASTSGFWTAPTTLIAGANGGQNSPQIEIDLDGGLHMAFSFYNPSSTNDEIYYTHWGPGNRNPAAPTTGPVLISDNTHDCVEPKITTYADIEGIYAIIVYRDNDIGSDGELMFDRVDSTTGVSEVSGPLILGCVDTNDQTQGPVHHEIANDLENGVIGVAWSENEPSPSTRNNDIHFGVVDYDNLPDCMENTGAVVGSDSGDFSPDIALDTIGDFHIVYQMGSQIAYNVADLSNDYENLHEDDVVLTVSEDNAMNPSIGIDNDIHRNAPVWDHDTIGRTNRFIHISFCRYRDNNDFVLSYVKLNDQGEVVVPEKDITGLADDRDLYYSVDVIYTQVLLNEDNQVSIVYSAMMVHKAAWPPYDDEYGIYYTKLDNNGEVRVAETSIDDDFGLYNYNPCAYYSPTGLLEAVWVHQTANGGKIYYSAEINYVN